MGRDEGAADLAGDPPPAAELLFGDRLPLAERYVASLATAGVERGLIGPREVARLWSRHLVNSALLARLPAAVVPERATVYDVGSGAGLPGIPLALARPDLQIVLLEPLERRATYLAEILEDLHLPRVRVERGRAEDALRSLAPAQVVASRALAPLERLLTWCLPLTAPQGWVVALKGRTAQEEVDGLSGRMRSRLRSVEVVRCGVNGPVPPAGELDGLATVVVAEAAIAPGTRRRDGRR